MNTIPDSDDPAALPPPARKPKEGPAARQLEKAIARANAKAAKAQASGKPRSNSSFGPPKPRDRAERAERASRSSSESPSRPQRSESRERPETPRPPPKPRDGSELTSATPEAAYQAVFSHAGRLLSLKDWSRDGLASRLAERFKMAPDAAAMAKRAADRMRDNGALDDARFARGFIRARLGKRSLSQALRELSAHGVSDADAQSAVEELRKEGLVAEPADQAYDLWRKKFSEYPADEKARAKQGRYMASRGFSYEALNKIWTRVRREAQDQDD